MSKELTWQTVSVSPDATEQLGAKLGSRLRGGEIIELTSDLGGGKTTFVRGLARGTGSSDKVASPSFTLSREYHAGNLTLYHFDFYRLNEPGIMTDELAEIIGDQTAVVVVEWGNIVENVLPPDRLTIHIATTGASTRQITYAYPKHLTYLFESKN